MCPDLPHQGSRRTPLSPPGGGLPAPCASPPSACSPSTSQSPLPERGEDPADQGGVVLGQGLQEHWATLAVVEKANAKVNILSLPPPSLFVPCSLPLFISLSLTPSLFHSLSISTWRTVQLIFRNNAFVCKWICIDIKCIWYVFG